jgi:hypothetical protein
VYAPELDPINVQKQPRLRLPQAAAADLESGTDLNPSNAAPSTLQVPETKFFAEVWKEAFSFIFTTQRKKRMVKIL